MNDKAALKELVKIRKALEGIEAVLRYALAPQKAVKYDTNVKKEGVVND